MSMYCTQADLDLAIRQQELIQLTDDDSLDVVNVSVLSRAIARASNRIDAKAGAHYAVPFSPIPDFIRDLAVDLTLVELAERRFETPSWLEDKRKRVSKDLAALAGGTLTVGVQPEPAGNPGRLPSQSASSQVFSPDTLKGF